VMHILNDLGCLIQAGPLSTRETFLSDLFKRLHCPYSRKPAQSTPSADIASSGAC